MDVHIDVTWRTRWNSLCGGDDAGYRYLHCSNLLNKLPTCGWIADAKISLFKIKIVHVCGWSGGLSVLPTSVFRRSCCVAARQCGGDGRQRPRDLCSWGRSTEVIRWWRPGGGLNVELPRRKVHCHRSSDQPRRHTVRAKNISTVNYRPR